MYTVSNKKQMKLNKIQQTIQEANYETREDD